jgi:hypothetical protein
VSRSWAWISTLPRVRRAQDPEQHRVAVGDVDLEEIVLQLCRGVGAVGLLGDHMLHRLVGEEGRDRQESRHHGNDQRRVAPIVRADGALVACRYLMPLLKPLI